jgi:hypothetical protein
VKRVARALAILGLTGVGAYLAYVVVVAVTVGGGHGAVFWSAIALLLGLAIASFWLAKRLYASHFAKAS